MAKRTYEEMNAEAMSLYGEQRFGDVLDLLNREGGDYPERTWDVLYLRSCMATRVGERELALSILRDALDKGYWYGETLMRESPSWQPLQGAPDFEQIAEMNIAREAEARANSAPRLFVLEPEGGCADERPCPAFVALHGNNANGMLALDGWRPVASAGWLLAAVQSSQVNGPESFVWDDQEIALREVAGQYDALRSGYALDEKRTVIAGFSMGGETALRVALEGTIPVRGFVLLGPGGPTFDTPEAWLPLIERGAKRDLRGYVLLGEEDDDVPHDAISTVVGMLNEHGIPCDLEMVPHTRHEYPRDAGPIVARALAFIG